MRKILFVLIFIVAGINSFSTEFLRVLTWEGYITPEDINEVNEIIKKAGYDYKVFIVEPYAQNADSMFESLRTNKCDVLFLTLMFMKLQDEKITKLLQPINVKSPRLSNYRYIINDLKNIPTGLDSKKKPLYIPFGVGFYGFYADRSKLKESELPKSIKELWLPKWKGKISLNNVQPWFNITLTLIALDKSPFYFNDLIESNLREKAIYYSKSSIFMNKLTDLYKQVYNLWQTKSQFLPDLKIVSSWGPEIEIENRMSNSKWEKINFDEGDITWMDTINFSYKLEEKKLEVAEIFANYMIGKKIQTKLSNELNMIAVSALVKPNKYLDRNPNVFKNPLFIPSYNRIADNLMKEINSTALKNAGK